MAPQFSLTCGARHSSWPSATLLCVSQSKPSPQDAVAAALEQAPLDDQPVDADEREAVAAAKKRGRFVTTEALRERLAERRKPG